jgi:hypothetical protein
MERVMGKLLKNVIGVAAIGCLMSGVNAYAGGDIKFQANLSGAQEVPGAVQVLIESAEINANFETDLSAVNVTLKIKGGANVAAAHFHCGRAGENGPVVVTLFSDGLGSVPFDGQIASGTLTNADVGSISCNGRPINNIASLASAMRDGSIYINVHTFDVLSGEVRGQMLED